MKNKVPSLIRILLIIMLLSLVALAALWIPDVIDYAEEMLIAKKNEGSLRVAAYVLSYTVTAIAISVFIMAFRFPVAIRDGEIFTEKTAVLLKRISVLILADCFLFGAGTVVLLVLGDRVLAPALAFTDGIGFAVAAMLWVLSRYVSEAAILKEEADCTL